MWRDILDTTLCDKVCPVSSTSKTDRQDITKILLKVALNTINQQHKNVLELHYYFCLYLVLIPIKIYNLDTIHA
jgi:hypothetical protein